jgi:hypothetical protein
MSTPSPEPPGLRCSDADRAGAAERLQQAMAEGRITMTELEERLAVVWSARYEAELLPPLADLPGPTPSGPAVPALPSGRATVLRAGLSGLRRTGNWTVPARLRVQSLLGSVLLDFCRAEIPHRVIEIELEMAAGSAKLLVPRGATANVDDLVTALGGVTSRVPAQPGARGPHFVVRGRCGVGSVLVRSPYRLADRFFPPGPGPRTQR